MKRLTAGLSLFTVTEDARSFPGHAVENVVESTQERLNVGRIFAVRGNPSIRAAIVARVPRHLRKRCSVFIIDQRLTLVELRPAG